MKASNSGIQTFKQCRRMYQLKYLHGLEPVQTADALVRGSKYHKIVEGILNGNSNDAFAECDDPKIKAMGMAFKKYILPQIENVDGVEEWFEYNTPSGHKVVGRIDAKKGLELIEHKTISGLIDGAYFQKLEFDEQIPTYMLAFNTNWIKYTVCSTPSIRQKKSESDEEFFWRCVEWFDEDTEHKIAMVELNRTNDELEEFQHEQDDILNEMNSCKLFYRNPSNCCKWGRMCDYASVCMNFDPDKEYIQFKRREDIYESSGEAEV